MAKDEPMTTEERRATDPSLNDDHQPSVTSSVEALRLADIEAGVPPSQAVIPAPADVIDQAVREKQADVSAEEVADAIVPATLGETDAGVADAGVAEEEAEGSDDVGTGPYEGRTLAQLRAAARNKGLAVSGSKDELVERLRG